MPIHFLPAFVELRGFMGACRYRGLFWLRRKQRPNPPTLLFPEHPLRNKCFGNVMFCCFVLCMHFPKMFEPLYSKTAAKLPSNFPTNVSPKNQKITDELLQDRQEELESLKKKHYKKHGFREVANLRMLSERFPSQHQGHPKI